MDANNCQNTPAEQPLEILVAEDAVSRCEKLESDFRNKGDSCHNNIGSKTCDDWERMDKFLVAAADEIRKIRNDVKNLAAFSVSKKLRNCDRFGKWDDAVHAFEQSVSPRWNGEWTRDDWIACVKWLFATANTKGEPNAENR